MAIEGKDVIGKATTGSGKTLAYGLPILERHIQKLNEIKETRAREEIPPPSGIIFAPTRELAHQVVDHLNRISKYAPLSQHGIVSITGGLSIQKQERMLEYGPSIIVATPGRLLELIEKNSDLAARLGASDTVVLDEADRLLQDGHFEEFEKILELFIKSRDSKKYGYKWQTLVFSATFSKDLFGKLDKKGKQKEKKAYSGGLIGNTEILDLLSKSFGSRTLSHRFVMPTLRKSFLVKSQKLLLSAVQQKETFSCTTFCSCTLDPRLSLQMLWTPSRDLFHSLKTSKSQHSPSTRRWFKNRDCVLLNVSRPLLRRTKHLCL